MMEFTRAREITGQCVRSSVSVVIGEEYVGLPKCSLVEMLEANEIVGVNRAIDNGDGTQTYLMNVDPRGIALHYAFENYGKDPRKLLEALGFRLVDEEGR